MCVNLLFFCTFVGKRWNGVTLESTMGRNLIQFAHFNPWERRTFQGNKGIWKQIPVFVKSTMMIVFEQKHQQSRPSQTKARVGDPWIQKRSLSSAPQNNMWHKTRSADLCWVTVHQSGSPPLCFCLPSAHAECDIWAAEDHIARCWLPGTFQIMLLPTGAVQLLGKYVRASHRKDAVNMLFCTAWWQEDVIRFSVSHTFYL